MDQLQDHTHSEKASTGTNYVLAALGSAVVSSAGYSSNTTGKNSGRSGVETRVKNISIRLWRRIS